MKSRETDLKNTLSYFNLLNYLTCNLCINICFRGSNRYNQRNRQKGVGELYTQAKREIAIANREQRQAIEKKNIFFIRRRKKVKRLQARIDANRALLRKLDVINAFQMV